MKTRKIAADLIGRGDALWSVECEVKRDRVIVYERLSARQACRTFTSPRCGRASSP
jgi:hypothetical protein